MWKTKHETDWNPSLDSKNQHTTAATATRMSAYTLYTETTDPQIISTEHMSLHLILYCWLLRLLPVFVFCFWWAGEAVNVSSGLGFNGYSEKGNAKWDLIDNADILKIEVSCIQQAEPDFFCIIVLLLCILFSFLAFSLYYFNVRYSNTMNL